MKSSFKKLPGSKIALEVTLDPAEFKEYYDAAEADALANIELKGFRKGTAPRELAERAIDKEKAFAVSCEEAVKHTLHELGEEHRWTFVDAPKIEVKEASPTGDVGLRYSAELTLFPEVKLGNYKKIAEKIFSEKETIVVEPAEIEKSLTWLCESRAAVVRVPREAREGDLVDADFEGFMAEKPIEGVKAKRDRFVLGQSSFPPGFDRGLAGKKAGESFVFPLVMPNNHWNKELAGKEIEFRGKMNAVFERTLPVADDVFAAGLGSNFKTVAGLRASIGDGLKREKEDKERDKRRALALDEIAASSSIDVPEVTVNHALDRMAEEAKQFLAKGVSDEELRASLAERARANVRRELVLYAIARAEHLEPSPEEVAEEAKKHRLDPDERYDYSYGTLRNQNILKFLEAQAHA